MNTDSIKLKDAYLSKALEAANGLIGNDERIVIALKGAFKEYLICTDKSVHIIKKGFMTGHTFGNGDFKMPYNNITNAEVDMHLLTGYFELSSGGLQNKRMSYWSTDKNSDPAKQPNVISLNSKDMANLFRQAGNYIMEQARNVQSGGGTNQLSGADEILKYKKLLDAGVISQSEFEAKKKQLLGL